jgi:hypothetical protein
MTEDDVWAQQSIADAKAKHAGSVDAVAGILGEKLATKLASDALTKKELAALAKELLSLAPKHESEAEAV